MDDYGNSYTYFWSVRSRRVVGEACASWEVSTSPYGGFSAWCPWSWQWEV